MADDSNRKTKREKWAHRMVARLQGLLLSLFEIARIGGVEMMNTV